MVIKKEVITSRNNPSLKWVASLKEKKYRDLENAFFVEGEKLSFEAFDMGLPIYRVYILNSKSDYFISKLCKYMSIEVYSKCEVVIVDDDAFAKISTENSPQGIITVLKYLDFLNNLDIIYKEEFIRKPKERSIILCSVRDPGNLGAVIRSSVAFGVERIFLSDDCADVYNPKTIRGAMGSIFKVKISSVKDVPVLIDALRFSGRRVFSAELRENSKSISEIKIFQDDVFVIGNEGHGIPAEISASCDQSVFIPIQNGVESLNASVAASLLMWEQSKNI